MTRRHLWTIVVAAILLAPLTAGADEPTPLLTSARAYAPLFTPQVIDPGPEAKPPTPEHTGFGALVHTTWDDFKALPRRRSTWVILGIGAASALLAHPIDDNVNAHLSGSGFADTFFAAGKFIGSAPVQIAGSVGVYLYGRYVVPPAAGAPQTNKWSHMGFDLVRAQLISQFVVQTTKLAVRRDRPTASAVRSRRDMRRRRSPRLR